MTQPTVLDVVADVWAAAAQHLSLLDVDDAAESVLAVLVDIHGYEVTDIYDAFGDSPEVRKAAKQFMSEHPVDDDFEPGYDDFDDED